MRRGKPSVHKAFDEATAILAGDALLTLAFGLVSSPEAHGDPFVRCELISQARARRGLRRHGRRPDDGSGARRRASAAPRDHAAGAHEDGGADDFCCEAGAIMGKASAAARQALAAYGQDVGLAYQIADDLLDLEGEASETGKKVHKERPRQGDAGLRARSGAGPGAGGSSGDAGRQSP